jgi:hypothetical protein
MIAGSGKRLVCGLDRGFDRSDFAGVRCRLDVQLVQLGARLVITISKRSISKRSTNGR